MATNATIASQIKRISDSRDILRNKGIDLQLYVPAGTYWDDATDQDITTTSAALLSANDQIDKVAAAFNSINVYHNKTIKVPLTIKRDGTTVVGDSTPLETGFYANTIITPYITVEDVEDLVLNIQTIANQSISTQTGTIVPANGFNYIDSLTYTIVDGAISDTNVRFDNTGVVAKVSKSGWLDEGDTQYISVDTSTITSKLGSAQATTLASGDVINPSALSDITLTVSKGIYGDNRTILIKSVSSQTNPDQGEEGATENDILKDKVAWVNGIKLVGKMPNYGGTVGSKVYTPAISWENHNNTLVINPALGYYNNDSTIVTSIVYNPTRSFNTTAITVDGTDTMIEKTYYETIPAGYYDTDIKRKVTVREAQGRVDIDYNEHTATFKVTTPGWIDSDVEVDINVGAAVYKQSEDDLKIDSHCFVVTPAKDQDGTKHNYLTQVTIDNSVIFDLLAKI